MFIINLQKLQDYVKVNNDFDIDLFAPYENTALNKYFKFMSTALIATVNGFSTNALGTPQRTAYELWFGALCRFSMLEYASTGEIQIGAEGFMRFETNAAKTAYKGQMNALRENLEETAFMEINNLVELFNANTGIFPDWATSPGSLANNLLLIKTANEFNSIQTLHRGFSTFMFLVPDMQIQQTLFLSSAIDAVVLNWFISNTSTDPIVVSARKDAVTALVQFTIARGIETGLVKLSGKGVQVIEEDYNTSNALVKQANLTASGATIRTFNDTGARFINKCIETLRANPTLFPTQPLLTTSTKPKNSIRM